MTNKRVLMIINPKAGQMTFKNSYYTVSKKLSDAGFDVIMHFTSRRGDATETVLRLGGECDMIIACGGDGTFNEAVNGLMQLQREVPIGYLPCGTTNDFASSLGISGTASKIADQIIKEQFVSIDAGKFNDRYFTYTASFGMFTSASYDTPQNLKNAFGHLAYVLNGAMHIGNIPKIKMRVEVDNYSEEGVYYYGGVTNTLTIGGLYTLPEKEVLLNDGKLELIMIRVPKQPQFELGPTLMNLMARNYNDPNILFMHGSEFVFTSEEDVAFTLDGEYGGSGQKNVIRCVDHAYSVNGKIVSLTV